MLFFIRSSLKLPLKRLSQIELPGSVQLASGQEHLFSIYSLNPIATGMVTGKFCLIKLLNANHILFNFEFNKNSWLVAF